jgi:hypothetical protein
MFASSKLVQPRHFDYPYPLDFKDVAQIFPVVDLSVLAVWLEKMERFLCPLLLHQEPICQYTFDVLAATRV